MCHIIILFYGFRQNIEKNLVLNFSIGWQFRYYRTTMSPRLANLEKKYKSKKVDADARVSRAILVF
jgi:hypothetical protein